MDKLEFAEGLGKSIIERQHEFFVDKSSEDLKHITNLKRIIVAMSDYLKSEGLSGEGLITVLDNLRRLGKGLFLDSCAAEKDQDVGAIREESGIWFDYICEHEEYPE
jgi:hypothetical protein